ncbi:hypothetical protein, partial [Mesorhizobium sp.]|uniref:hypothetical protein n=1 Tax=Mesorhizobium sp. TaxID=1871066 RepID=UPI0025D46A81
GTPHGGSGEPIRYTAIEACRNLMHLINTENQEKAAHTSHQALLADGACSTIIAPKRLFRLCFANHRNQHDSDSRILTFQDGETETGPEKEKPLPNENPEAGLQ